MSDPAFITSLSYSDLLTFCKENSYVEDLSKVCSPKDIEKVQKQASIVTQFVIVSVLTTLVVIAIFLAAVIPCVLPLGTVPIVISTVVIVSVLSALFLGAGLLFFRLSEKRDPLLEKLHFPLLDRVTHEAKSVTIFFHKKTKVLACSLDISTLDASGTGKCLGYLDLSPEIMEGKRLSKESMLKQISLIFLFALPFLLIASMGYNLLRVFWSPVYVLVNIIRQHAFKITNTKEETFVFSDIFVEMGRSIQRVVTAPFYAMALLFSLVYSLINVRTGRIIVSLIERDWNNNVELASAYHLWTEPYLSNFNDWGRRQRLKKTVMYVAGCMQPRYVFDVKNWEIISGSLIFGAWPSEGSYRHKTYIFD